MLHIYIRSWQKWASKCFTHNLDKKESNACSEPSVINCISDTQDRQECYIQYLWELWGRVCVSHESALAFVVAAQQYLGDRCPCTIVVLDGAMWSILWKIAGTAVEDDLLSWHMLLQKIENGILRCWQCTGSFTQRCLLCVSAVRRREIWQLSWILQLKTFLIKMHPSAPLELKTSTGSWLKPSPRGKTHSCFYFCKALSLCSGTAIQLHILWMC